MPQNNGQVKILEPMPDVGEKNAKKTEEFVTNMEQDVVASYIEDVSFIIKQKLSKLK